MEKYILDVNGLSQIALYSDIDSVNYKMHYNTESLTKTLPVKVTQCGEVSNIIESSNFITIMSSNGKTISVNRELNTASLFCQQAEFFFPDLVYLTIGLFANDLQRKGYYFLQSSVVKYDDYHSIMLIGDPNAGKTSLAYNLIKDNDFELISNDNVLVNIVDGKMKTHCGTKTIQMRYGGIKLYFPEILPYVDVDEEDKSRNEWDIKLYIDEYIKQKGYRFADDSIVTDIYNITTFKTGDTYIRSRERIDEILLIYEHLTKQIRSNRYALTGFNYPLPSFEDERFLQQRYDMSKDVCEHTNIYEARGTIDELSKRLVRKNGK